MAKLATEYQGFLKFIARANKEIINWFAPHCNNDPCRITFMAAREWDGMADDERRFFIKAQRLHTREGERRAPSGANPFLCYLLHKRYTNFPSIYSANQSMNRSLFHPQLARFHSEDWKTLPKEEREKYAGIRLSELGIDHVIEKRDRLHELYDPQELTILEFILKTKPKKPRSSRAWFLTIDSLSINSTIAKERWVAIVDDEKRFYEECARLDKKRFNFEKSAWITKLLSIDLTGDEFTLADFESQRAKSSVDALTSIIEFKKDLILSSDKTKRPLSAFSMFIKDFRAQTKEMTPVFKFGQHLRDSAAAWAILPEEKKQVYKDESRRLRESYKQSKLVNVEATDFQMNPYEISASLFRHTKSITGPSRPSHLLYRVPNVVDIYGKANNVSKKDRKRLWESLPLKEKEPYCNEYERIKNSIDCEKNKIKMKISYVRELIEKAKDLEKVKKDLNLLRSRKRVTKNLYL